MIELKDVVASQKGNSEQLNGFSLVISDGELRCFDRQRGELIINVIVGFCPIREGYVCFDGMPLNEHSAPFLRKLIAYVPSPEGFQNVSDLAQKQSDMLTDALQSEANIILAVDPFSHLSSQQAVAMAAALQQRASQGAVVIVASDSADLFETSSL